MKLFSKFFGMFGAVAKDSIMSASVSKVNGSDLSSRRVVELRTMAKSMGLSGYSSMRKAELVNYIEENRAL
jgi:hypothetical protein